MMTLVAVETSFQIDRFLAEWSYPPMKGMLHHGIG
jgi:hypothetical protein